MFVIMEALNAALSAYLEQNCDPESDLLARIHRETYLKETKPHMLSGHYQGRVLAFISKLHRPQRVLEIGTFTGYATLCLAEGLSDDGEIHTIDSDLELHERVSDYFAKSPFASQIHQHHGHALDVIPSLPGLFDLVFIDADKSNNKAYFELAMQITNPGAIILIDNVLWKGKVVEDVTDKVTNEIRNMNAQLTADQRVEKLILPIRDGLFVLRKRLNVTNE